MGPVAAFAKLVAYALQPGPMPMAQREDGARMDFRLETCRGGLAENAHHAERVERPTFDPTVHG
jgi:hypothetical protein